MITDYRDLAKQVVWLDDDAFEKFVRALERPEPPKRRLVKLLKTIAPWEKAA